MLKYICETKQTKYHMQRILALLFLSISAISYSQNNIHRKTLKAVRIDINPTIDGKLDEAFWKNADIAKDFVMIDPGDGDPERLNKRTEVKIAYNNEALFVGATLYEDDMNSIAKQFGNRDQIGIVDYFLMSINPNNDGLNDTQFIVMSTGQQRDVKVTSGSEDATWNAVWDSDVYFGDGYWTVEMKIPYYALRFNNEGNKAWGVNFSRSLNSLNEEYVWNYIDKTTGIYTQYAGILEGMYDIKPPIRLSFSPYAQASNTWHDSTSEDDYSIGLDLKYGLSESFTLDATLIPDFGQTAFDDLVLNLGPFEQRYQEQRAFFTEGTELFDKGGLFYSRRIGNAPVGREDVYDQLEEDEIVTDNPNAVNMLNAIKISGRTPKGLGIGFFNAITEVTSASIKDTITGITRTEVTEPFTNYNVFVLDQQFNQSSSVTLVNTNTLREGSFRDANVTGLLWDIFDKSNTYKVRGNLKLSSVREYGESKNGAAGFLSIGKVSGNWQYGIAHWRANDTYDIRDLGFQRRNNYSNYNAEVSYETFEPNETFNKMRFNFEVSARYLNEPNTYTSNEFEMDAFFVTIDRFAFGGGLEFSFGDQYDYFEPRVEGRYFKQNGMGEGGVWISTDYRKKFAMDVRTRYGNRFDDEFSFYFLNISPRYRFSDKFEMVYALQFSEELNDQGYVTRFDDDNIIFGQRDVKTVVNSLSSTFNFNTKSNLSLSFRYYWSPVNYDEQFYKLNDDGTLFPVAYDENHDINYNIWNLDLSYSWWFAPGSQLIALYRNSIFNQNDLSQLAFDKNLDDLFDQPGTNILSLKFIYFIDYNNMKNWF